MPEVDLKAANSTESHMELIRDGRLIYACHDARDTPPELAAYEAWRGDWCTRFKNRNKPTPLGLREGIITDENLKFYMENKGGLLTWLKHLALRTNSTAK